MGKYVDGFVVPLPKRNVAAYRRMAVWGSKLWRKHGALDYRECIGDDLEVHCGMPFPRQLKLRRGETVAFSWIVFKSRAHRDRVNAKVMNDPALAKAMKSKTMPFDMNRMLYGGFKTLVGK